MDLQDLDDMDDPRQVEVNTMAAIFPEMKLIQTASDHVAAYTITLQIPVDPIRPVTVHFAAATNTEGSDLADNTTAVQGDDRMVGAGGRLDSHQLTHLPPVHIKIDLGADYPAEKPPSVSLSTSPPWLPHATLRQLEDDGPRLWEEMGRDAVVYSYIDHVQLSAEDVFGLVDGDGGLEVDAQHKIAMLDYDNKAKKAAFERGTYDCGVCLDPKKGTVCHRMMDCGHVFCVECLQSFYNDAISEGSITAVRCLDPFCTREREKVANAEDAAAGRKPKAQKRGFLISPSELLQIPLGQDTVKRYVTLKYKTELEADRNTIYCPRQWCNGAARSKRHKKPQGLEFSSHSGDEKPGVSDEDDDFEEDTAAENLDISNKQGENGATHSPTEKLCKARVAICEDCGFAFCVRCSQSWHGEFVRCRRKPGEIDEDERATLEYMKLHTTACPTCAASAQKTHGCNHMICARCNTHFCYLCASWLDPYNPYGHFNEDHEGRRTGCYMRLWELEFGDGAGAGYANGLAGGPLPAALVPAPIPRPVAGGDAPAVAAAPPLPIRPIPEIEEVEGQDAEPVARRAAREVVAAPGLGRQVDVAREGPLVLRIAGNGEEESLPRHSRLLKIKYATITIMRAAVFRCSPWQAAGGAVRQQHAAAAAAADVCPRDSAADLELRVNVYKAGEIMWLRTTTAASMMMITTTTKMTSLLSTGFLILWRRLGSDSLCSSL
ncbi:hypothetical protein P8C59_000315 [Phyllachora maydis]|uniref:RBR-type E3 ubiquitin transferase n=1 Tax=Phyllachora maydis TaxID=1825666 RepID=A0AAD9HVP8_9PEZI|nr:hypothetical protein P8C59_000315 [Phyllachora maydis]